VSKVKIVVVVVLGLIALALAYVGFRCYRDYRRDRADKCAVECVRDYSRIVGDGRSPVPAKTLGPVLVKMTEISDKCSKPVAELLFSCRLDGAFLVGDYALAEKMMDAVPEKSASWKEGAKAKVRAHAALARGDKAAAIGEFEAFCQALLRESPDIVEYDPCTGMEWSREGLLARNLKRMSGLAADIGDKDRAARFLEESRRYAAIAFKKVEGDADKTSALAAELEPVAK